MKNKIMYAGTALLLVAFALVATPSLASAATYAFVNKSAEVSVVVADNPNQAIQNAFNISAHSGVILLSSLSDSIVGNHVNGI